VLTVFFLQRKMQEKWPADSAESLIEHYQNRGTDYKSASAGKWPDDGAESLDRALSEQGHGLQIRASYAPCAQRPEPCALSYHHLESYHCLTSVATIPALNAASIPRSPSSKTSMNSGSIFIWAAHLRKVSGCGLKF
jgi:hypothetical protein